MWPFAVAFWILFFSVIPLAAWMDDSTGHRRENIAVLFGLVLGLMVAVGAGWMLTG